MAEATVDLKKVNGNVVAWGSGYFKLRDKRYYGLVEVTYGEKRERVEVAGANRHHAPEYRSPGKYTCEVSKVKMLKHTASAFRADLAEAAEDGVSYGNVEFEGVYQFIEPGIDPQHVELRRCVYQDLAASASGDSADPLYDEINVKPMFLVINGKCLFDATEGMPA
jgi:hypothetical protein